MNLTNISVTPVHIALMKFAEADARGVRVTDRIGGIDTA